MKTKFQTTAIPRALGNSVVMASVALLSVVGSAAYAQSFTSGPDQLVNRLCSDQCEQQGETLPATRRQSGANHTARRAPS